MIKKFSEYKDGKDTKIVSEEVVTKPLEQKSEEVVNDGSPKEKEHAHVVNKKAEATKNGKVEFFGKVAKFPKNVEPNKANSFLENIKVKKTKLWYLMVEKQTTEDGTELQMLKYNKHAGVNLSVFLEDLKKYYVGKYPDLKESFALMTVGGDDKFSTIKNIPNQEVEGRKMITILMNDLVKLLGK
jgi:hypothetical protein